MGKRTYLFWLFEFVCVTAIAVILAIQISRYWIIIPAGLLAFLKLGQYRVQIREEYLTVRSLLDLLETFLPYGNADLRCTYHVPVRRINGEPKYFLQAFDYVPKGSGGSRKFPISKGIIGRAYRQKGPRVENFKTGAEYREKMQKEYGYTEKEIGDRTPDRRSYLAYPIVEGGTERVLGVLYFDSNTCDTFQMDEKNEVWKNICDAVQPIKRAIT